MKGGDRVAVAAIDYFAENIIRSQTVRGEILSKTFEVLRHKDIGYTAQDQAPSIGDDWLNNFADGCKNTTDGDIQRLWAKVFIGKYVTISDMIHLESLGLFLGVSTGIVD
jgi:hypothetical protein